jgi:hypothetical protein
MHLIEDYDLRQLSMSNCKQFIRCELGDKRPNGKYIDSEAAANDCSQEEDGVGIHLVNIFSSHACGRGRRCLPIRHVTTSSIWLHIRR